MDELGHDYYRSVVVVECHVDVACVVGLPAPLGLEPPSDDCDGVEKDTVGDWSSVPHTAGNTVEHCLDHPEKQNLIYNMLLYNNT